MAAAICMVTPISQLGPKRRFGDGLTNGKRGRVDASHGTQAKLLLAFWATIGFKPGDFMITGMNEKRAARLCRVLNRVTQSIAHAL